jgi:hypothetical protein
MPEPAWDNFSSSYREHVLGKEEVHNRCLVCGKVVDLPRKCSYCKGIYCDEHALPELHNCKSLPARGWAVYKAFKTGEKTTLPPKISVPNYKRPNLFGTWHNKLSSHRIISWLRRFFSYLFAICYVLFFSLPVGVAVIVSMANLDSITRLLMTKIINQVYLFALCYVLCACYLFYQKITRKDTRIAYIVVAGASVLSTWILLDSITPILILGTLLGGQTKSVPNILNVYQLWVYALLDLFFSSITPLVYNYAPGRLFINNIRYWIAERVRQII